MKVLVKYYGYYPGTDAIEALGTYDTLEDTEVDALNWAFEQHSQWEKDVEDAKEDCYFWESLDFEVFEYDPDKHDCLRAGGGSFADDFKD